MRFFVFAEGRNRAPRWLMSMCYVRPKRGFVSLRLMGKDWSQRYKVTIIIMSSQLKTALSSLSLHLHRQAKHFTMDQDQFSTNGAWSGNNITAKAAPRSWIPTHSVLIESHHVLSKWMNEPIWSPGTTNRAAAINKNSGWREQNVSYLNIWTEQLKAPNNCQ